MRRLVALIGLVLITAALAASCGPKAGGGDAGGDTAKPAEPADPTDGALDE